MKDVMLPMVVLRARPRLSILHCIAIKNLVKIFGGMKFTTQKAYTGDKPSHFISFDAANKSSKPGPWAKDSRARVRPRAMDGRIPSGHGPWMARSQAATGHGWPWTRTMEAAGVEPASRDVSAQTSTCVFGQFKSRRRDPGRQGSSPTSQELF